MSKNTLRAVLSLLAFAPAVAHACACGCGVFDVGTGSMLPTDAGGSVWLEYNYMDQNRNWAGASPSSPANNPDREIVTHFITAGGQYMFNRSWGAEAEIPYVARAFNTTDDDGNFASFHHASVGDIRLRGIYAGFSDDMSTGISYGVKLPTGDSRYAGFDRDTEIGTGSTDWLLGAYHRGALTVDGTFGWFTNAQWSHAFTVRDHYRPGDDWNAGLGSYYNAGTLFTDKDKIAPLLQLLGSYRLHDVGVNADPDGSGYRRLMISPGIEYDANSLRYYADIEFPVYQNVNGNQLTAPVLTKLMVGYNF